MTRGFAGDYRSVHEIPRPVMNLFQIPFRENLSDTELVHRVLMTPKY